MEAKLYFQMLKRGWWLILLTALVASTVSLVVSYLTLSQYVATASFLITPNASLASGPDVIRGLDALSSGNAVTSTYAEIMNSRRIYASTLSLLGISDQELVDYTYEAVALPSTSVIELSVSGPDPLVAAELANAIGSQTIDFTSQVNRVFDINFLDAATAPTLPISPQPMRDAGLSLLLGIVLGAALVIFREQIRSPYEAYLQHMRLDSVTGVYNNRYFRRLIEEEIAQNPDNLLSIGIVELDGLKDMLNSLPVASLNSVLQRVKEALQRELRGNDVIGRWNEFTFSVMLPNTPGVAANRIFERIFQVLSVPLSLDQLESSLSLDPFIGGAEYSNNITTQELLEKADDALAQARRGGISSVYTWSMKNPFWSN
jgi:diguanylate cyclase (GGDEF)-like protein